jgi:hypothetical protein
MKRSRSDIEFWSIGSRSVFRVQIVDRMRARGHDESVLDAKQDLQSLMRRAHISFLALPVACSIDRIGADGNWMTTRTRLARVRKSPK